MAAAQKCLRPFLVFFCHLFSFHARCVHLYANTFALQPFREKRVCNTSLFIARPLSRLMPHDFSTVKCKVIMIETGRRHIAHSMNEETVEHRHCAISTVNEDCCASSSQGRKLSRNDVRFPLSVNSRRNFFSYRQMSNQVTGLIMEIIAKSRNRSS